MTDTRQYPGNDCSPTENPAPQPKPPKNSCDCDPPPPTNPPKLEPPKPCDPPDCKCPPGPGSDPDCLETLIGKQSADIAAAEKAKTFKADLEAFLAKARAASQEYTRDRYEKLLKQWVEEDRDITELIRKLVCAVPCWRCIIECYVCPLLNKMRDAELWLYGDGTLYSEVHNLNDELYWHTRNKEAVERRFQRIKSVLAAWEKPAQTIERVLVDNKKLIADASTALGADAPKAVFDVFLRLVPIHLAIAPPAGPGRKTNIDKKFTEFCGCDAGQPDDCCGPDVGKWTLRQQLIGAQPYLIDPNDYFKLICCLVDTRYGPAQKAASTAEADVVTVEDKIKRYKAVIENGLKSFDKDAKGAIPSATKCCHNEIELPPQPSQAS